jgi:hypothetical protein
MKNIAFCVIAGTLALSMMSPVVAQDAVGTSPGTSPWSDGRSEAPSPQVRSAASITRVAAEAPQPEARRIHIDRFWVVGSFR